MRKVTNKKVISEMLAKELAKDDRFKNMSLEAALADIKANKRWLTNEAYVLYVAYTRGLSGLRDYAKMFESMKNSLIDRIAHFKELQNLAWHTHMSIGLEVSKQNGEDEPLPF